MFLSNILNKALVQLKNTIGGGGFQLNQLGRNIEQRSVLTNRVLISFLRGISSGKKSKKMSKYTIVMVRHGESEWNKLNLFCGWYDSHLSDKGN